MTVSRSSAKVLASASESAVSDIELDRLSYDVAPFPTVDVLVVGGGGSSGNCRTGASGGGGAGGVVPTTFPGYGIAEVEIGAGAAVGAGTTFAASNHVPMGGSSKFGEVNALGGGSALRHGNKGASGGGSGHARIQTGPFSLDTSVIRGRNGIGVQGNNGGNTMPSQLSPYTPVRYTGGGGGGAGGAGGTIPSGTVYPYPSAPTLAGQLAGGAGAALPWLPTGVAGSLSVGEVSGPAVYFGGGGAGIMPYLGVTVAGGVGGGGDTPSSLAGGAGSARTGGGAGSPLSLALPAPSYKVGANGGSGVVVLRTLKDDEQPTFGPGLTVASDTSQPTYNYYAITGGVDDVKWPTPGTRPSNTYVPPIQYLVVGGGGGGGGGGSIAGIRTSSYSGGGGGGGGVVAGTAYDIEPDRPYLIDVGVGGRGAMLGDNGMPSAFGHIVAEGGGGGGFQESSGKNGGCGGGGGGYNPLGTNGGTGSQGGNGGSGTATPNGFTNVSGGGGGGAGGNGSDGVNLIGGNGGVGIVSTILPAPQATAWSVGDVSGSDVYFASGGGGCSGVSNITPAGTAGSASVGGGTAANNSGVSSSGAANTGGGQGAFRRVGPFLGNGDYGLNTQTNTGGSGVVILRLIGSTDTPTIGAGLTYQTAVVGSDRIIAFTAGRDYVTWE
jgi:hypothetical protein